MPTPDATVYSPSLPSSPACAPCSSASTTSTTSASANGNDSHHGPGVNNGFDRSMLAAVSSSLPPISSHSQQRLHQSQPCQQHPPHLLQQPQSPQHPQLQQTPLSSPLFGQSSTHTAHGTTNTAAATAATAPGNVPDPAVMEFISKIGQIIIKARTQQAPVLTADHLAQAPSHLDSVLQDKELWRNNSSVYINIFHSAQFALLERWVISFTPPALPPVAMDCIARSGTRPNGFLSPLGHSASGSPASPVLLIVDPGTPLSSSSAASRKDTTDLILLVQSLYTQIRALPLNNCLTSFEEATRITKDQLDYTVTSGHEDLTQSCQPPALWQTSLAGQETKLDMNGDPLQGSMDMDLSFSQGTRQRPPLEFLAQASLKLVQFEASHKRWGCVRVTGMYDESVGHRVSPDQFQNAVKAMPKKSHRRPKDPLSSKSASRKHRLAINDSTSTSKPSSESSVEIHCAKYAHTEAESSTSRIFQSTSQSSPPRHSFASSFQRPMSPIPTDDDLAHHQTSSLIRHGLHPPLYPSKDSASTPTHRALQESLNPIIPRPSNDSAAATSMETAMEAFQFPPLLSPPLAIPEKGAKSTDNIQPAPRPAYSLDGQRPPQTISCSHTSTSSSPVRHTISRRRSSRLSIVMNRGDLSPEPTSPLGTPRESPTSPIHGRDIDVDMPHARPHHRPNSFKASCGHSPTKHSYVRRNSLNPLVTGVDLFGSLVGSYEESILSGRMSTMPSKPLTFTAQIGVLASQDYKDCPAKLRCPRHVQLEFPAVFYDYDSSSHQLPSSHHHYSHQHHYHHNQHHPPSSLSSSVSKGWHHPTSSSHAGWADSSPLSGTSLSGMQHGTLGNSQPQTPGWTPAHDDPVLPYVGNVDLDNGFRGSKRFAKMPGGMRIPLRGQVQVMVKNPNKTVVKVFLVPYDFTDMPPNTKTFLRQKYYSLDQGIPALTSSSTATTMSHGSSNGGGTLRYAIHLQFCCPAEGYVFLYRTIRVVFANRVPDGKEKLRIVLEGLGVGNYKTGTLDSTTLTTVVRGSEDKVPTEEKYVPMRKGEVLFSGRRKRRGIHSEEGDHSLEASPQTSHQQQQQHLVHKLHHPLNVQIQSRHHHQHFHSIHPHTQHPRSPSQGYHSQSQTQGLGLGLGLLTDHPPPPPPPEGPISPMYPAQKWTLGQMGPNGEMQAESTVSSHAHVDPSQQQYYRFGSCAGTRSPTPTSPRMSPVMIDGDQSPSVGGVSKDWELLYKTDTTYQDIPTSVLVGSPIKMKNVLNSNNNSSGSFNHTVSNAIVKTTSYHHHPTSPSLLTMAMSTATHASPSTSSASPPSSSTSSLDRLKSAVSNVSEEVLRIKSLAQGLKHMGVRSPPSAESP